MCGIAGTLGIAADAASKIAARMHRALDHRGPDDSGIETIWHPSEQHPVVLVHRRLAILDLSSAGHQPMCDKSGATSTPANWIVFNGEVFNYQESWPALAAAGLACTTRSDTEVILKRYRLEGRRAVEQFRGMFAWCLIDVSARQAWFCRDRLGIKPLYLFRPRQGGLLFASELRALLAAGPEWVPPEYNPASIESFLAQGAVFDHRSIVHGVKLLAPGESLITDFAGQEIQHRRYWDFPAEIEATTDRPKAVRTVSALLREAVSLRLISDRPLGLFLSGGVDSAALATLATEVAGTRLTTLSVGLDVAEFDESEDAARIARELGTDHQSIRVTGEQMIEDFSSALAAMDQPTVDGFNVFVVSRAARRAGLTVALSGLGGDELFGGYASFTDVPRAWAWQRFLHAVPLAGAAGRMIGVSRSRFAAKASQVLLRPTSLLHMYLLRRELFPPDQRRALHDLPHNVGAMDGLPHDAMDELSRFDSFASEHPSNAISRFEIAGYMRHMLLRDADVFSMNAALELRVPFLDHRLVEQVLRLPGRWKVSDPRPKPLLIDAVGARFPAWVSTKPKRGFTFPWRAWLNGPLRSIADESLRNGDVWRTLRFDPEQVMRLWQRFNQGDRTIAALQVLALMVLARFTVRHGLRSSI